MPQVRTIAEQNGWIGKGPLPDDEMLAAVFEQKPHDHNPTHQSLSHSYEEQIRQWVKEKRVTLPILYFFLLFGATSLAREYLLAKFIDP